MHDDTKETRYALPIPVPALTDWTKSTASVLQAQVAFDRKAELGALRHRVTCNRESLLFAQAIDDLRTARDVAQELHEDDQVEKIDQELCCLELVHDAHDTLVSSRTSCRVRGDLRGEAAAVSQFAEALLATDLPLPALHYFIESHHIYARMDDPSGVIDALLKVGNCFEYLGKVKEARTAYLLADCGLRPLHRSVSNAAIQLEESVGQWLVAANLALNAASQAAALGDSPRAVDLFLVAAKDSWLAGNYAAQITSIIDCAEELGADVELFLKLEQDFEDEGNRFVESNEPTKAKRAFRAMARCRRMLDQRAQRVLILSGATR